MKALALVAGRELRAYGPAWIAALVTALLPWLAPLLPAVGRQPADEVRLATAAALATLLGLALAAFTGAGLLARDLAEGRIGFFLALPLPSWSIWLGRLLAATLLVYGSMALVTLPPALAAGGLTLWPETVWGGFGLAPYGPLVHMARALVALVPLFLILLAHQLATALRSRSPWLLVDLGALAVAGALVAAALARLFVAAAVIELAVAVAAVAALVLLVLGLGGGFGLARGGVLLSRVHRVQASAVGAGLLVTALLLGGAVRWMLDVSAADVTAVDAAAGAPAGPWIAVFGPLRHRPSYSPWLLVDTVGGGSLPLSPGLPDIQRQPPVVFAAGGREAVWLRPRGHVFTSPSEAVWVELGTPPRLVPTGIEVTHPWEVALLPAGDRLVVAEPRRLALWTERGRRLAAVAELPRAPVEWQQLRWVAADRVRLVRLVSGADGPSLQCWDLDAQARLLRPLVDRRLTEEVAAPAAALSADGTRLLLARRWSDRGGVALLDAASGEPLAQLSIPVKGGYVSARFLPGGRVAVVGGQEERLTLRLFDRQGGLLREHPLGAGRWAWLGSPWSVDVLPFAASVRAPDARTSHREAELRTVDLRSGAVRRLAGELIPLHRAAPWWPGDDRVPPGAPLGRLFRDADGTLQDAGGGLVRLDAEGRRHRLLPAN
jgi:hypothetical protein